MGYLDAVDQPLDECAGQRTVSLDLRGILFQRPVLLKALFALLTRGVTAGFLSLCGGALSLAVFCLLLALPFTITGYIFSVSGALAHNCGQLLGAAALLSDKMAITYAPMLLIAGLIVGSCTYMVSRLIFPAVKRIIPPKSKAESKITF